MFPQTAWISPAGTFHLVFFGLLIPVGAIRTWRRLIVAKQPLPNRIAHFRSTAAMLVLFTGLSLLVARVQWIALFPAAFPDATAMAAGLGMYALAIAFMGPRWRRAVERKARVVYLFMPDNATERAWWMAVSVLAGVGEEITWRGVQVALLIALTGNYWVAALLSAASFGVAHMMQGWRSAAIIAIFAMGFSTLVFLSGSLYVAMAVHVTYDITAGLTYGRLGRQLGY